MAVNVASNGNHGPQVHDAKGNEVPAPNIYIEQGVNSPFPAIPVEYNAQLYPRIFALRTYEKMKRNDAQVRLSLRVCKFPVVGGEWYMEPASDDQEDKDAAEFVEYNLFNNLTTPWQDVLTHILTCLDYGFSILEEVFEEKAWRPNRDGGYSRNYTMLRKLAPRPAVTLDHFEYDRNGGPKTIWLENADPNELYSYSEGEPIGIPIDKTCVFTWDKEGGNLEGMSVLRSAYQHWYYKTNLYKIDAIQKERHGIGIPDIELPAGHDADDLKFAGNLARNMRTNEYGFILRPMGWGVGFAKVEGQLTNALESAEHHDLMIARNVLAQFINGAGSSQQGSRSNMATSFDLLLKSLRQVGAMVCSGLNQHVIPQLVDYNFSVQRYPILKVRGIGESRDQQMLAAALRNLVSENIISVDDEFEKHVRGIFDFPEHWDEDNIRVNENLYKPFTDPELAREKAAGTLQGGGGNKGTASAALVPKGRGRGPAGGNQPKATTEG